MFTCSLCKNRFRTKRALREHAQDVHVPCTCCKQVFQDRGSLDSHLEEKHSPKPSSPNSCSACNRTFRSQESLNEHYRGSSAHPNCVKCGKGFESQSVYEQHATECVGSSKRPHSDRQVSSESTESRSHTPAPSFEGTTTSLGSSTPSPTTADTSFTSPSTTIEQDFESWAASAFPPLSKAPTIVNNSQKLLTAKKEKWRSDSSQDDLELVSSMESLKSSSLMSTDSWDIQPSLWHVDPPSLPTTQLRSPDVSSPELSPLPTISPTPSTPISQSTIAPAVVEAAHSVHTPWSQWPQWPQRRRSHTVEKTALPRISTSELTTSTKSPATASLDRDLTRYGFKPNDSLLAIQVPEISPLVPINVNRGLGLSVSQHVIHPGPDNQVRTNSHLSHPNHPPSQKIITRRTSETTLNSSTSEAWSTLKTIVPEVSFHCRLCLRNPCENTTATICGHVFCNSCITQSVIVSPKCPVCQSAVLLYCLFRLDLSC